MADVFEALRLEQLCAEPLPSAFRRAWQQQGGRSGNAAHHHAASAAQASARRLLKHQAKQGPVIYADSKLGRDDNNGSSAGAPVQSLERAVQLSRAFSGTRTVLLAEGTYFLSQPLVLTVADSHLTIAAKQGERVVVSGGAKCNG